MSKGPSVISYDEQEYSCQLNDTWAEISKRYYMTDRYAKALQRHNQNHVRASEPITSTGQIKAGARIFIPQAHILEERYADAIPKPSSAAPPTIVPTMSVVPNNSPPPQPPPANGTIPLPSNP